MTGNRRAVVASAGIFLVGLVYYLSYYKYLPLTGDEGHLVNGALRVLDGQLPLKDFYQAYTPGRYWLLAFLFRIFGPSLSLERLLWVIVHAVANVLMYLAAKRSMPPRFAAIPLLTMMIIPGIWHKTLCNFLLLANVLVIYRYVERFDRRSLAMCAVAAGFTVWFRQDIGGYAALTIVACLLLRSVLCLSSGEGDLTARVRGVVPRAIEDLLVFSAALALTFVPLALIYWWRSGLYELLRGMTIGRIRSVFALSTPFPSPLLIFSAQPTVPTRSEVFFLYGVLPMLAAFTLLVLAQAARCFRKTNSRYNYILLATLVPGILLVRSHVFPFAHFYRLPQDGALTYILGGYVLYSTYTHVSSFLSGRTKSRRIGSAVGIACTLALLSLPVYYVGYTLVVQSTAGGGMALASGPYVSIDSARAGTSLPQEQATVLNETINYIATHTDTDDTIFAFNTPQLYFLAYRRNASRQDKIIPSLAESWAEEQLVEDLRENKPPLVLVSVMEVRRYLAALHLLREEIAENYRLASTIGTTYVLERGRTLSSPHSTLGLVYEIAGEEEQAGSEYRLALDADPNDELAREHLAQVYLRQCRTYLAGGQMAAALGACQEGISLDPRNAEIHEVLGGLYRRQNLIPEAVAAYERAVELDPSRARAFLGLGVTYERWGRLQSAVVAYQEAVALYQRAVELDPSDADAYEDLGFAYLQLGRIDEAISAYQEAVALLPSSALIHERLGRAYREQGQLESAAAEYETAAALDPTRASAYWGLGQTYERLGRFQGAIEAYQEVVTLDPSRRQTQRELQQLSSARIEDMRYPLWASLGDMMSLLGYDVETESLLPGETLELTLWWESLAEMDRDYTVFVQVFGPDDRKWAQLDTLLVRRGRGTSQWPVGWTVRKRYQLKLPPDAPSGRYVVKVGMYYWATEGRLPAWDGSRERFAEDAIALEPLTVGE
jgi:tetratricopeptide (TPR) repeat protein